MRNSQGAKGEGDGVSQVQATKKLVVAISSRALFDLSDSHEVFERQGLEAYSQYQIQHENDVLKPGQAFAMVNKLLAINKLLGRECVEVILLSRNSADTGLRVFNSIHHYGLNIVRAAFTGGESPFRYIKPFNSQLFLSADADDVGRALEHGIAAATLLSAGATSESQAQLRFAFDGDAVLFSDEAERIYQAQGLEAFARSEKASAKTPLTGGPFRSFLASLQAIQQEFSESDCPIRTALVTARSAPAHERVILTLRDWGVRIDESLFLGGLDKGMFLKAYGADVFFDDQRSHCDSAAEHVAAGHVPHGISNE